MATKSRVTHYESLQKPLDEEERVLMDPQTWDWENAYEIDPSLDPHLIFQVRLSGEDLERIESAAIAHGMNVNAFLRCAGLEIARQRQSNKPENGA